MWTRNIFFYASSHSFNFTWRNCHGPFIHSLFFLLLRPSLSFSFPFSICLPWLNHSSVFFLAHSSFLSSFPPLTRLPALIQWSLLRSLIHLPFRPFGFLTSHPTCRPHALLSFSLSKLSLLAVPASATKPGEHKLTPTTLHIIHCVHAKVREPVRHKVRAQMR